MCSLVIHWFLQTGTFKHANDCWSSLSMEFSSSQCSRLDLKIHPKWLHVSQCVPTILCCSETWRNDSCPAINMPGIAEVYSTVLARPQSRILFVFFVQSKLMFVRLCRVLSPEHYVLFHQSFIYVCVSFSIYLSL